MFLTMSNEELSNLLLDNNFSGDYRGLLIEANRRLAGDEGIETVSSREIIERLMAGEFSATKHAVIEDIATRLLLNKVVVSCF